MGSDSRSGDDPSPAVNTQSSPPSSSRTLRILIANAVGMVGFVAIAVWNGDLRLAIITGLLVAILTAIGSGVLVEAYDL